MPIVRRERRRVRKTPEPGAGIRRSEIQKKKRASLVRHDIDFEEQDTLFGRAAIVTQGPYEVLFEVMAPNSSTGMIVSEEGTLTIMGRSGVLFVRVETDEGEKLEQVHPGDAINISPGQNYSLASGTSAVDFTRVQTSGYFEGVEQVTPAVIPDHQKYVVHISPAKRADSPDIAEPSKRRSYDSEYRKKLAELRAQDRAGVKQRKQVTREVRTPKSPDEIIHDGKPFRQGAATVVGVNPRPMGEAGAAALMTAEMGSANNE